MADQPRGSVPPEPRKPLNNLERIRQLTAEAAARKAAGQGKTPPPPARGPGSSRIQSPSKKGNPPPGKEIVPPIPILLDSKEGPSEGGGEKGAPPPRKGKKGKGKKKWGGGLEKWEWGRLPHGSTFKIDPWDGINMLWRGSLWIPAHTDEKSGKDFPEITFHAEAGGVFPLLRRLDIQYRAMIRVPTPAEGEDPKP